MCGTGSETSSWQGCSTSRPVRFVATRAGCARRQDEIAWRLHTLTRIIAALSGSYNDYGVRRWFQRPRAQLDGQTPAEVFTEVGGEDDEQLNSLVELAEALVGPALAV